VRRPLDRLVQAAEIAANGEWEVPIEVQGDDEAGRLAKCLLTLTEELRRKSDSTDALGVETSHRRETEMELREREEYYRRLFEYSNDAVFITNFDGRILETNNKACAMLGIGREELVKIPFMDLQLPEETGRSKAAYKTGTQTGSIRYETRFKRSNGEPIDVEISASIVEMKKGILQNIVSNITERKESERNLRESEEKFRTFMETASDLMFITDAEGRFSWMNQAMLYTLGYAREELVGVPFAEVLDRDHLETARMKRRQFTEWGENIHQLIWETKTRKKIQGEMKTTAIYDNDGRFRGLRGVFRDVTERKKVEESQRLAELGKLASDMAHEVNNQIAVIATRAAVAKMRKNAPGEVDKDLSVITSQCEQVKDVLKAEPRRLPPAEPGGRTAARDPSAGGPVPQAQRVHHDPDRARASPRSHGRKTDAGGIHEPPAQRVRGHAGRRRNHRDRGPGRGHRPHRFRGPGHRDFRSRYGQGVRPLLHDERERHRARPVGLLRHRPGAQG
jgi:PAS domain S-box-containing protein